MITNGVFQNKSNFNASPLIIEIIVSIITNMKVVIPQDIQYTQCDNPIAFNPNLSFFPFS